jgi:hypothetical protein
MVVVTDVRTRKVNYGNRTEYWKSPFSRAQGVCGKSRATEFDETSGRRALGVRRAFACVAVANDGRAYWAGPSEPAPLSATLSDRLGCLRVTYLALNNGAQ